MMCIILIGGQTSTSTVAMANGADLSPAVADAVATMRRSTQEKTDSPAAHDGGRGVNPLREA
jgi:hypothetical protein